MLNKKALGVFLGITFGLTIALVIIARLSGFTLIGVPALYSQMVILAAMFVPAISALVTQKLVLKKPLRELGFKLGPASMYLKTYLAIVAVFAVNYAITYLFIAKPDLTLNTFLNEMAPGMALPLPAGQMLAIMALITFVGAPIFNLIPSLGEEIGWRGFLLPSLEPLGQLKAAVISGMVWGLWHTPMILILGFFYGKDIWLGALFHFIMATSLGVWMGYIWFKTRSTILAAFIHAVFNANAYGVWTLVFVSDSKLTVGAGGVVGVMLCLMLGLAAAYKMQADNKNNATNYV